MRSFRSLVHVAWLLSGLSTLPAAAADAPLNEHLKPLARLIGGQWVTQAQWADGSPLTAREVHQASLDGNVVRSLTFVTRPDGTEYQRYEAVNAWDPERQQIVYHSFTFNHHVEKGEIEVKADGSLLYPPAQDSGAKPGGVSQTIQFIDDDTFLWTVWQSQSDGSDKTLIKATWKREPLAGVAAASEADNIAMLEFEQVVAGPVAEVWSCWSTTKGAETFFARKANIDARPGGAYEILFAPDAPAGQRGAEDLKVLSVLPPRMISFEWSAPPQFKHARPQRTWVVVTLEPVDAGHTRVRLTHLGWDEMKRKNPDHAAEWDEVREYFANAWPRVLGSLKERFEDAAAAN